MEVSSALSFCPILGVSDGSSGTILGSLGPSLLPLIGAIDGSFRASLRV